MERNDTARPETALERVYQRSLHSTTTIAKGSNVDFFCARVVSFFCFFLYVEADHHRMLSIVRSREHLADNTQKKKPNARTHATPRSTECCCNGMAMGGGGGEEEGRRWDEGDE